MPSRRASSRVTGLDAARVFATFGIVWVHVSEIQGLSLSWSALGRFGTSFYILAAVFLAARAHLARPATRTRDVARRRARRLLLPFVVWCAIYAAFYFGTMAPQGYTTDQITRHWGPLFGTAPHLWFLPFAWVAGVCASLAVPRLMRLSKEALGITAFTAVVGAYVLIYGFAHPAISIEWTVQVGLLRLGRWVEEIPLVVGAIFGVAIYGKFLPTISRMGRDRRKRLASVALAAFLVIDLCHGFFLPNLETHAWNLGRVFAHSAGACWLVAFVSARRGPFIEWLAPLGQATYFAYLFHQLLLDALKRALSFVPGHGSLWFALLSSIGIFLVSAALGLVVARVRALRFLSP